MKTAIVTIALLYPITTPAQECNAELKERLNISNYVSLSNERKLDSLQYEIAEIHKLIIELYKKGTE